MIDTTKTTTTRGKEEEEKVDEEEGKEEQNVERRCKGKILVEKVVQVKRDRGTSDWVGGLWSQNPYPQEDTAKAYQAFSLANYCVDNRWLRATY